MKGDPPARLEALVPYFRGIQFATGAIKRRLAAAEPSSAGLPEIERYEAMATRYHEALRETASLHATRGPETD